MHKFRILPLSLLLTFSGVGIAGAQVLSLREAVETGLQNYSLLKAKTNYVAAARAGVEQNRREALPDLSISAQQVYGTVNGQTGPAYPFRGLNVSSAGPALPDQNWNAAFGALYLANINWDFYSFGKARERTRVSQSVLAREENDLKQERFRQQLRIAGAYLNLLAAERLTRSQRNNLERAEALRTSVVTRVKNGLNAGVDSSLANAEVSNARIALTRAIDYEQEQANALSLLMGTNPATLHTDTAILFREPQQSIPAEAVPQQHPVLQYYQSRIALSKEQSRYIRTFSYPTLSAFGVIQGRGSGFGYNYVNGDPATWSSDYGKGVEPTRSNYLLGIGLFWNLSSPLRIQRQAASQDYVSRALQDEYELADQQLKNQMDLALRKMQNALSNHREAPVQVKAAADAFLQKSVLYRNGLSDIVNLTQALYALNRAETDRDIAAANVWQALLLEAAAAGDFELFIKEF